MGLRCSVWVLPQLSPAFTMNSWQNWKKYTEEVMSQSQECMFLCFQCWILQSIWSELVFGSLHDQQFLFEHLYTLTFRSFKFILWKEWKKYFGVESEYSRRAENIWGAVGQPVSECTETVCFSTAGALTLFPFTVLLFLINKCHFLSYWSLKAALISIRAHGTGLMVPKMIPSSNLVCIYEQEWFFCDWEHKSLGK